jgi:hypothetical protein
MAVLDAVDAEAAVAGVRRIRARTDLKGMGVREGTVEEHTWPSVDPLYLRVPCFSLPVLRSRLP